MKKVQTVFLALLLLFTLLAGCANDAAVDPASPSANGDTTETKTPQEVSADRSLERNAVKLPLVTEPVSFTMWTPNISTFDGFRDYYDNEVYKEMEKRTGVHLDFIHPIVGSENENFQLLMASNDIPDFLHTVATYYLGGMDKAIDDQTIIPLNDYVKEFMPNYAYHLSINEDVRRQSLTDKGNLWGIHHIVDRPQGAFYGLGIRQDWLDKEGLSKPVTYSDLENVLTIFRDKYTRDKNPPLYLSRAGFGFGYSLSGSFNVAGLEYINVGGKVRYSPMEPGFKEYVMKMNDWHEKGLLDPDSISTPAVLMPTDLVTNNDIGIYDYIYTFSSIYKLAASDPDFQLVALTTPIPDGKTAADVHVRMNNDWIRTGNSMAISTTCENVEVACKYWDYLFSDEGIILANYGIEGVSFEYDKNNLPQYTPQALAYNNITYTQVKYCLHNQPVYTIWSREVSVLDDNQKAAEGIWGTVDAAYIMPQGVTLTEAEGAEHSSLKSSMDTFVQENTGLFITGQKSFDAWDSFIAQLKKLGVDRAVEIQQGALDRYYARGK